MIVSRNCNSLRIHVDLQNAFKFWANGMVRTPYRATILPPQKFGKENHHMLIKPLYFKISQECNYLIANPIRCNNGLEGNM